MKCQCLIQKMFEECLQGVAAILRRSRRCCKSIPLYYDSSSSSTLAALTLLIIIKFCRNVENFKKIKIKIIP